VGSWEVEVCVLQFANDTLFLCEKSFSNVINMKAILRYYVLTYGMKINFHKYKLTGINVENASLSVYAKSLHCNVMRVPFKYLRLEVGGNPRKKPFWESILNKISVKLSAWKGRFLSLAERICLVKSVFTSME